MLTLKTWKPEKKNDFFFLKSHLILEDKQLVAQNRKSVEIALTNIGNAIGNAMRPAAGAQVESAQMLFHRFVIADVIDDARVAALSDVIDVSTSLRFRRLIRLGRPPSRATRIRRRVYKKIRRGIYERIRRGVYENIRHGIYEKIRRGIYERIRRGIYERIRRGIYERLRRGTYERIRRGVCKRMCRGVCARLGRRGRYRRGRGSFLLVVYVPIIVDHPRNWIRIVTLS